ncbi:MAG: helix-turn-helix domain-containing protein [Planctomycetota bacterium]
MSSSVQDTGPLGASCDDDVGIRVLRILTDHIERHGAAAVARYLGIDRSTISRRIAARRVDAWTIGDLIALCRQEADDGGLRLLDAIGRALFPDEPRIDNTTERRALHTAAVLAGLTAAICRSVDGAGFDAETATELKHQSEEAVFSLRQLNLRLDQVIETAR